MASSKELLRAQLKARATESPEERERRRKEREEERAKRRGPGGEGDEASPESGTSPVTPSKIPPDALKADEEVRRRPRAVTAQPVTALAEAEDARRRARAATALNEAAEAEELASLLDRAAVDANVLKAKLMHSKNLSYAEKTQVTKKLFDTILMEGGMLPPAPELPSAAELSAQLSKEREARLKLESQLLEATTLTRTLEAQLRDARAQVEALQTKEREREKRDKERDKEREKDKLAPVVPPIATATQTPASGPSISPRISPRSSVVINVPSSSSSSSSTTTTTTTTSSAPPASSSSGGHTPQTPRRKTGVFSGGAAATFGEALGELVGAAQDVPLFVSLATAFLEGASASTPDLFIRSGDKTTIAELRKAVQSGRYDLGSAEPHAVSDLVVVFLEELPSPLIPAALVPLLAETAAISDSARRTASLRCVLWSAPATARAVLLHLLAFLHGLLARPTAKSTAKDLVRVVGPAMLGLPRKRTEVSAQAGAAALTALECVVQEGDRLLTWSAAGVQIDKSESALRVSAGTVEALLALAADAYYGLADADLADVIISTHSYFTGSPQLLQVLKEGVRIKGGEAWQRRLRLFALSALKRWLTFGRRAFRRDKTLLKDAKSIVSHFKPDGDVEDEVHRALLSLTSSSGVTFEGQSGSELLSKRKPLAQKVDFLSFKAADIASQLTLIDWAMLREISAEELLHKNYTAAERSPNFAEMVDQFNRWSQLVPSEVLAREHASQRAEVLALFIDSAHLCVKNHNNFNSACAILAGLGHPSVTRLRSSWSKVPRKSVKRWKKLQELFDMGFNFRNYRAAAAAASSFIPYLGILPKDLLAIEENHPTRTDDGAVNVVKLRLLYTRGLTTLSRAQACGFGSLLPHGVLFHFLAGLDRDGHALMHDDDAHAMSQKLEPKK